jgi:hypothetical protein
LSFDYSILSGKIVEKYRTRSAFAKAMGISERTLSVKLNNKIGFRQCEMSRACELLDISESAIPAVFFTEEVQ